MRAQTKKNIQVWEYAFDEISHLEHTSRFFIVKNHFYRSFFRCGRFLKSLLNLLLRCLCFIFCSLATRQVGSYLPDQESNLQPCTGRRSLNHWTTTEVPTSRFLTWKGSVQFSSVAQSYPTLCDPMNCSTPDLPVHHHFPEFTQTIESVMPSNHLILGRPLRLLPPIPPSIKVVSNESTLHMRWPK